MEAKTTTIKERLYKIAELNSLSVRAFEEKCNLKRGNISNMAPNGAIGSDKLTKILDTFPGINIYWVLTGNVVNPSILGDEESHSNLVNKLLVQAEEIGRLRERVRQLEQRLQKFAGDASIETTVNVG